MTTSADRLKEERLRVGMSQEQLALAVGMSKGTQTHYETGKRMPDVTYLAAVNELGLDAAYIVTGQFAQAGLPEHEHLFLSVFRRLDQRGRKGVMGAMLGYLEG
ncbi:helix-turn-helix domain-containing protein [Paraburkholderia phenazinium]|uniref:helix-turn-helix domain-containing protein n=1 Tax=Paraburkholderia phenazinium TaxID=60549 RepID=UPI00158BFEE9|nr:helix-turn-helix transcriptional regulator [Paraburkholderia phenazinium]